MSVLIEVWNDSGSVGRCDARCYLGTGTDCGCICGGANHGKGLKQAQVNTEEQAKEWLTQFRRVDPSCFIPMGVQQPLFKGEER